MDILFWSGGKDAFLALHCYQKNKSRQSLQLLTTYDESRDVVPHQAIELNHIKKQAQQLEIPLITVALPPQCSNDEYISLMSKALDNREEKVENLIFGDYANQEIRDWREKTFAKLGYNCLFPIWDKSMHELLPILQLQPVNVEVSAVQDEYRSQLNVGEPYDQALITQLGHLDNIDAMGENGEFHTKVIFPGV